MRATLVAAIGLAFAGCFSDPGGGDAGSGSGASATGTGATATSGAASTGTGDGASGSTSAATSGDVSTGAEATESGGSTGATTGSVPTGPTLCGLALDAFTLSEPLHLADLSTGANDTDPSFWGDLRLYYATKTSQGHDVLRSERAAVGEPFGPPGPADDLGINTASGELRVHLASEGRWIVFASDRPGGAGKNDLWYGVRAEPGLVFDAVQPLGVVNTADQEFDPWLSSDRLRLYFNRDDGGGGSKIYLATRAKVDEPFGAPAIVPELDAAHEGSPFLSEDERLILFTSNRGGDHDIWLAARDDPGEAFGAPVPLPTVNSPSYEGEATLRGDGCELIFVSDRAGGLGGWDLYQASVIPR